MRADWTRIDTLVVLSDLEIQDLFQQTFPGCRVTATEFADGGLSNTNIMVRLDQFADPMRLRLFHRGAEVAALEHAVSQRVASEVPLPLCHCASFDGPAGRPYAIYSWVAGERLESVDLPPPAQREIGRDIGRILAAIHRLRFEHTGYLNSRLEVIKAFGVGSKGLIDFARSVLETDRGRKRLGDGATRDFLAWLDGDGAAGLLDLDASDPNRAVLCHGDFGASNLIANEQRGHWRVAAVLDWEYACAGTSDGDLGNLLRPPFDEAHGFQQALVDGYRSAGGTLPEHWRDLALLSDLFAWIKFLGRDHVDDSLVATARSRIAFAMRAVTMEPHG